MLLKQITLSAVSTSNAKKILQSRNSFTGLFTAVSRLYVTKSRTSFVTALAVASSVKSIVSTRTRVVLGTCYSTSTTTFASIKFFGALWSFAYGVAKFIGVKLGTNAAANSTSGKVWNSVSLVTPANWSCIAHSGSATIALALNYANPSISTDDGVTWSEVSVASSSRMWTSIAAGGSTFVGVGLGTNKCIVTTNSGLSFAEYTMPAIANWTGIAWNGTVFCAVSDSNVAATSTDGMTWTARTMPDNVRYSNIGWNLGQFTAVAVGPTNLAAKSTDGISWTRITMPAIRDWRSTGPGFTVTTTV